MHDLIAVCAFGLEAVVKRELADLGLDASIGDSGRVHFRGDVNTIAKTNVWLRTADRVLLRVGEFPASTFDELFETTRQIRWDEWLPADASFPVTGRSIQSKLTSVPACQRSVKRAVADAMLRDHGVEQLPETGAEFKIDIALLKDVATLTIDTTGRSLHRRGYRTDVSRAPLKETLAAAMVMLSFWKPGRPLIDPFCGSGSILIEAARIARNMAPGLDRSFASQSWPLIPDQVWEETRESARQVQQDSLEQRIIGRDIDGRVLKLARENARRAGVEDDIHFQQGPMQQLTSQKRFGCIITNPPYGLRLGGLRNERENEHRSSGHRDSHSDENLRELYEAFPDVFRKLPTWSHYVLTAFPRFESIMGRPADRRRKLYNGRIECTYYQYHGPKPVVEERPESDPAEGATSATTTYVHASGTAAFGGLDEKAQHQSELFATRLRKRMKHLRRWPTKRGITCFRLYERDIPELPFVVDRYNQSLHITEYERPHDRDPATHANWLDLMAKTAGEALEISPHQVFLKTRRRQTGKTQHEKLDTSGHRFTVDEGGLKFLVNLADYIDTGLFLDHRVTRQMIREEADGKSFLNLFAYTGSFTVYAAAGGARRTTSVDLSKTYLDWAWENMRNNGFSGNEHRYVTKDVAEFVRDHAPGEMYDLVVLDPPTFSNSKRTLSDWDVQRDTLPLIQNLLPLVRRGGVIYFSNNFRRFKWNPDDLEVSDVREISRQTVPEDFRNQRIHRCWRIVR